jgi:signal transduction histidine kinase/DNA-binding response OmpR family regulator
MIYGGLRIIDNIILHNNTAMGLRILIICLVTTALLTVIQTLMKSSRYVPLVTGLFIMCVFIAGSAYLKDFRYYFISMLCVAGIVCIYQRFRAVLAFFSIGLFINVPLYFTLFRGEEIANQREMVIDGLIFIYGFVFLLILAHRVSVRDSSAQQAQNSFDSLLITTPNMMIIVDDMRKVCFISEQMAKFADCPAKYAVGRPLLDLFRDFEVKLMFADIIDSEGYFEDIRKIDIDGAPHYFKIICDRLQGGTTGMFIDVTDVTATVAAKNEAEIEKENAVNANRSKSKFLATMSHEIRTPMNAIIGISQLQMSRDDLPPDSMDAIGKIYTSGHTLLGIINDILDLSKIETGKLELLPNEYDLPSLINDSVQLNITRIGSKPIEFTLNVSEDVPSVLFGDELRLKQILNNILSNAIKYTDRGFVSMSVSGISTGGKNLNLIVSVADTGQGMKKEDAEALGDEFARFNLEANRSTEGTGLGMSITKRLINLMNGKLDIDSEYGAGSTFTVTIPQIAVTDRKIGAELAAKLKNFTYSRDKQAAKLQVVREYMPYGHVLVVDDVETNIYVAEGLLKPYGIKVDSVTSGYETIDLVKAGNTYDIIFMDHMMPKMDGIETTEKLREMGYGAPIVALTANAIAGNDVLFKSKGFDDFISKPIDIRQLNASLNRFVRNKEKAKLLSAEIIAEKNKQTTDNDNTGNSDNTTATGTELTALSPKLIEVFIRDAEKAAMVLSDYDKDDLKLFTTTAHAMKSACANVGNPELSELAKDLETAGREADLIYIEANAAVFIEKLTVFTDSLKPSTDSTEEFTEEFIKENTDLLYEKLTAIAEACDEYDEAKAEKILTELSTYKWSTQNAALLSDISSLLLHAEFEESAELARKNIP